MTGCAVPSGAGPLDLDEISDEAVASDIASALEALRPLIAEEVARILDARCGVREPPKAEPSDALETTLTIKPRVDPEAMSSAKAKIEGMATIRPRYEYLDCNREGWPQPGPWRLVERYERHTGQFSKETRFIFERATCTEEKDDFAPVDNG